MSNLVCNNYIRMMKTQQHPLDVASTIEKTGNYESPQRCGCTTSKTGHGC